MVTQNTLAFNHLDFLDRFEGPSGGYRMQMQRRNGACGRVHVYAQHGPKRCLEQDLLAKQFSYGIGGGVLSPHFVPCVDLV